MCEIKYLDDDVLTLIKGQSSDRWSSIFMVINWIYLLWFPFQYCSFPWCGCRNNNNKLRWIRRIWAAVYSKFIEKNKKRFEVRKKVHWNLVRLNWLVLHSHLNWCCKKKNINQLQLLTLQVHTAYWTLLISRETFGILYWHFDFQSFQNSCSFLCDSNGGFTRIGTISKGRCHNLCWKIFNLKSYKNVKVGKMSFSGSRTFLNCQ